MKPKAYSYVRWSSDRQSSGDSLRRQLELSEAYAAEHGLDLDTSLRDEGVSAYQGLNRLHGQMATFLHKVEVTGEIRPGSYLLVESLDRISREEVIDAQALFLRIVTAGITIVTLAKHNHRLYSRETLRENHYDLIVSLLEMVRAHEESKRKGGLVAARMAEKRKRAAETGETFTKNLPAWISLNENGRRVLNDRAAVVREIFELMAQGIGRHKIVNILNTRREPVLGSFGQNGWHASHIHHLLHQKTVLGVFQPHRVVWVDGKRKRIPQDPIPNYYEPAVDEDLYWRAHAAVAKNHMGVGRKGKRFNNLLTAGLTRCGVCGAHMNYQDKGAKSVPNYVCSAAVRKLCSNTTKYRHSRFEEAILTKVVEVEVNELKPQEDRTLEIDLAARVRRRDELKVEIDNLYGQLATGLKGLADQIAKREAEVEAMDVQIERLRRDIASRAAAPSVAERLSVVAKLRAAMKEGTDEEVYRKRAQLAAALREVVTDVVFEPEGYADMILLNGLIAYRIGPQGVERGQVFEQNVVPEAFVNLDAVPAERQRLRKQVEKFAGDVTPLAPVSGKNGPYTFLPPNEDAA